MTENMDKTITPQDEVEFAHVVFSGLIGVEPQPNSLKLARQYWNRQFISPWADTNNPNTAGYARRFLDSLDGLSQNSKLVQRWQSRFNGDYYPQPGLAKSFISDFMQAILHYPRSYHDFSCHRQSVHSGHVMDFPIQHPLAVDYWTVYISHEGQAHLSSDAEQLIIYPHNVLIMPPGQTGAVSRTQHSEKWNYDLLSFRSTSLWLELLDWTFSLDKPAILNIEDEQWLRIQQSIHQLEHTTYQAGHYSERLCHNLIENLLINFRLAREKDVNHSNELDPRLQSVVSHLLIHYQEPAELTEIAQRVRLSPSQLNALFRKQFGTSVIKWRDGLRLQKAKELLMFTALPINEIAELTGYPDPLYFSRRFRQQYLLSPRAWRNQASHG
ncbi:MAG: helix-turn-helix domain-containing protein [Pseudomonadales bacterium]